MKKGLAFVLVFALIFGSFGFAFASDASNGIKNCIEIDKTEALTVSYGGIECKAVKMTDKDFVVIKQATFAVIWTKDALSSDEETALIEELKECDGSLKNAVDNFYFTTTQWLGGGGNEGNYYFDVSAGVYDMEGMELSGKYAIASPADKVSHFLIGTFNEEPTYTANYTIDKEVIISAGAPATKDFTFNVEVSGAAMEIGDKTITIPAGSTEGSVSVNIANLEEEDFPFELIFTENSGSGDNWTYDGNEYKVMIGLDDQKQVTYNGSTSTGTVTFVNTFDGLFEINIPFEKDFEGDPGFPGESFDFIAKTTPGGVVLGTTTQTFTPDGPTAGIINVEFPAGTTSGAFPITLLVEEDEGTNPSWGYDGAQYLVTVSLVGGVPTITGCEEMTEIVPTVMMDRVERPDCIVFTNTYTAPLAFEIPFTKNVAGEQYGSQSFDFTAELIVGDVGTVATDTATLHFSDGLQTSSGAFEFELTSTQAATWLPAQVRITETAGSSSGWTYDGSVYWASVDEDGTVSDVFNVGQTTASSVTFTNSYEGEPVDLEIPIYKLGSVLSGSFRSQTFSFDVSVQNGDGWEALTGTSITLTYPNGLSGQAVLSFSGSQLEQYGEDYGYPVILRIVEQNGGANYWTYDNAAYDVQIQNGENGWYWNILSNEDTFSDSNEILFQNSYRFTGGTSNDNDRKTTNVEENVIPLEETTVEIQEVVIPEAEIPATGGIGIGLFLALGGIVAATGVAVRRKENKDL